MRVTEDGGHGRVFEGVRTYVAQSWRVLRSNRDVATFLVANTAWEGTFAGARTFVVLYVTVGLGEPLVTSTYILGAASLAVGLALGVAGLLVWQRNYHASVRVEPLGEPPVKDGARLRLTPAAGQRWAGLGLTGRF